jgi:hypothetical protein
VKRRHPVTLFSSTEPDIYLIDTSAWSNIDSRSDSEAVWRLIEALIEQGRIVACAQVLRELHDSAIYTSRLKRYEQALQAGDQNSSDPAYLLLVGKVTHAHPAMSRATGTKTPADP